VRFGSGNRISYTRSGKKLKRRLSKSEVLDIVRNYLLRLIHDFEESVRHVKPGPRLMPLPEVTIKQIADDTGIGIAKIDRVLYRLKAERLIRWRGGIGNDRRYSLSAERPLFESPRGPLGPPGAPERARHCIVVWDEKVPEKKPRFSKRLQRRLG